MIVIKASEYNIRTEMFQALAIVANNYEWFIRYFNSFV